MTSTSATLAEYLGPAPRDVRARMLADADNLRPGVAAVVGRFFRIIAERGEPVAAPSRESFDVAATSEPTLGTLLRALTAYAPQVCLAGGREARRAWYARRKKAGRPRRKGPAPVPSAAPSTWPTEWASRYPGLLVAPIEETSRRRYVASISRCADALPWTNCRPDWSRWFAYCLLEVFEEEGLRPRTIASYLDGLIALGKHGGVSSDDLAGLHDMRNLAHARAVAMERMKVGRIEELTERGGLMVVPETIGKLRDDSAGLPASSAAAERMRQTAAILGVELQAYARTGDVAGWVLGNDLIRDPCGTWRLEWTQGKTGTDRAPGELWPEIGEILDELILAGRPQRYAGLQYQRLLGSNWLTHTADALPSRQPSYLVRQAIGVPLHDLRTVIADLMRRVDPKRAAGIIATLLGHRSTEAGEEYRALCQGEAATRDWSRMRSRISESGGKVLAHP